MTSGIALDAGTVTAKVAVAGPDVSVVSSPAPAGDWQVRVSGALAAAGMSPSSAGAICLAVPEAWLDASVAGTVALEALRQACAEGLGIGRVTWTGQLAAVAAQAAGRHGPGRYLVCDIGASGVRTAALEVTEGTVRILAAHHASGGGWRDFDASVRALGPGGQLPAEWYQLAMDQNQERRARALFGRVTSTPKLRESPVYMFGECRLLTGQVADCFAPTGERVRAGTERVLGGAPADIAVLTGGLGWFPLASLILAETAGVTPVTAEPAAAARGALLFARGAMRLVPSADLAPVTLPAHRVRHGRLEEITVPVPWAEPFARPADGPLVLDEPELTVDIDGQRMTVPLPGLVPGPCVVGVRSGWSGSGALVVRAACGSGDAVVAALGPVIASRR